MIIQPWAPFQAALDPHEAAATALHARYGAEIADAQAVWVAVKSAAQARLDADLVPHKAAIEAILGAYDRGDRLPPEGL